MNMLAYVQGKDAYSRGFKLEDNPYFIPGNYYKWTAWRKGWLDMEARD